MHGIAHPHLFLCVFTKCQFYFMQNFHHPFFDTYKNIWSLLETSTLKQFVYAVKNQGDAAIVNEVIDAFETEVQPNLQHFTEGLNFFVVLLYYRHTYQIYQQYSGKSGLKMHVQDACYKVSHHIVEYL